MFIKWSLYNTFFKFFNFLFAGNFNFEILTSNLELSTFYREFETSAHFGELFF